MSQKTRLLDLLRVSPHRTVTCFELSAHGLYHHGSQRCGELRAEGYDIEFVKGETWETGRYILKSEPLKTEYEPSGQAVWV